MEIKETVGIDISKNDFDVRIHKSQDYNKFMNDKKGFKKLLKWVYKLSKFNKDEIFFVFEHTGLYSHNLAMFLAEEKVPFSLISGLEIKRSMGITRGKDDKIDATKIAYYAYLRRDELRAYTMPSKALSELQSLFVLRKRLVTQRAGFMASLGEIKRFKLKKENTVEFEVDESMIKLLSKKIEKVEKRMDEIIESNTQMKQQFYLLTSIPGVGAQNALSFIITTHAFTKFNTWREYAAYCGIAPFPHKSGTSVRGKTKVSSLANKNVKVLLTSAAYSVIRFDPELKNYFQRKIDEGKNKNLVINNIRCKIIARMFAVLKRDTVFVNIHRFSS